MSAHAQVFPVKAFAADGEPEPVMSAMNGPGAGSAFGSSEARNEKSG